jgi:hypothetical protein
MATSFPTSLDDLTFPVTSPIADALGTAQSGKNHSEWHRLLAEGLAQVQAKVGADDSAVATSLDARMRAVEDDAIAYALIFG